jgi:hypothetical protein
MANARNSAGINDKGGKNVNPLYQAVKSVTSYVGNVAREVRDIPTAIGASITPNGQAHSSYRGRKSTLVDQIKEAGAAITTGQKGSSVQHYTAAKDFKDSKRRK